MFDAGNIIILITATLAFVGTWLGVRVQRQRLANEASTRLTETAISLIKPLETRIDTLEEELREQRTRRYELENRVRVLEEFIRLNTEFDPEKIA